MINYLRKCPLNLYKRVMPNDNIVKIYSQLYFSKEKANTIQKLFDKVGKGTEFEIMFNNYKSDGSNKMNSESFLKVLQYAKRRSKLKGEKLEEKTTLDVVYNNDMTNYRVTVEGIDNIKDYLSFVHKRKNHVILKIRLGKMLAGDDNITIDKKIKNMDNIVDIDEYNTRVRVSNEEKLTDKEIEMLKSLNEQERSKISFRYKQRVSLILKDSDGERIILDITNTKQTNNVNKIQRTVPRYEVELEYMNSGKGKMKLDDIYKHIEVVLKVLQQSNFITSKVDEEFVIKSYSELLGISEKSSVTLDGRKAQSLEIQHVVDILPNKYAVTDKADGERSFLVIFNNSVYLITDTLHVKRTGIDLASKTKYNNTVLDGEYIFIPKQNRHLFMAFDCLFVSGEDIRKEQSIMKRLEFADKVVKDCFIFNGQKGFDIKEYSGKFNCDKIVEFHGQQIDKYMESLDFDLKKEKIFPLIRRKYFINVLGGQDNEIFKYSTLMWQKYVLDSNTKCPYILDGLIYHPLEQMYTTSVKDSKFFEYKWKPQDKNSIDFYIKFERDPNTNNEYVLFDNSKDEFVKGKPYKICHLYVGKMGRNGEQPVLFQKESGKYKAHLFLENGEARDIEGNIIQDGTVVEFAYAMDAKIDEKHRWRPLRTRDDKTESVILYKKRYGNYVTIANRIWRSIINPFTIKDMDILSKDSQYRKQIEALRNKIDHSLILSERKENIYYQIRTNLAKPMRNFHNWIKSILIYTYCNQAYERGNKQVVLDIGSGRGGDLMKFYYTMVALYVGIDIDSESLLSAVDGAVSRYEQLRSTHPNFPKMTFIQADGGVLLNYESQVKALGAMSKLNKSLMEQYFSLDEKKRTIFDRINCQFAIHFFLENKTMWQNFCENLNMYLKEGGYFIFTCFDGDLIQKLLTDKDKYTSYYTNEKGEKKIMFEIVKKYSDDDIKNGITTGIAIDMHNAIDFQEGVYMTEFLVNKEFIVESFDKYCDLELVDTDLFGNQFYIHSDFFSSIYQYEENSKTKEFFRKVAEFYNQKDSVNKAGFDMTVLNRYYVFRRREHGKGKNNKKKVQKGGGETELSKLDGYEHILGSGSFYLKNKSSLKSFTLQESIFNSLQSEGYIPKNISLMEFYDNLNEPLIKDSALNSTSLNKLAGRINIDHEINGKTVKVIEGLNILTLEKDCDGDLVAYGYGKGNLKSKKSIILFKDDNGYHQLLDTNLKSIHDSKNSLVKKIIKEI